MDQGIDNQRGEVLRGGRRMEEVSGYASQAPAGMERAGGTKFRISFPELKFPAPS